MATGKIRWGKLAAEGLMIVASVYLAIGLETRTQDRERVEEATAALAQLREELRNDRADIREIRASQERNARHYENLIAWLDEPAAIPGDSMQAAILSLTTDNRTMFPRSSAWTTMVAAAQLTELDNPDLVTRLGNLYENINVRLFHNGAQYDNDVSELTHFMSVVWNQRTNTLQTTDPDVLDVFWNRLRYMYDGWNQYYLDLLDQYEAEVEGLIVAVGEHLDASGWES